MMEISPAKFRGEVPSLDDVVAKAQSMCEVRIEIASGNVRFANESRPDALVHLSRHESSIFLQHLAGDAPALRELLVHALIVSRGEFSFAPKSMQFPLTAAAIEQFDRRERRAVNKASFGLLALIACAVAVVLGLLVAVVSMVYGILPPTP